MLVIQSKEQIMMQNYQKQEKSDYKKFMRNTLDVKTAQKNLLKESDLYEKTKTLASIEEIETIATKVELKFEQEKIVKL